MQKWDAPEQISLVRKAHDSLRAAKLLVANSLPDVAVSRAYYTMFYVVEAFLLGEELAFSSHSAVISAFGREFARTGRVPAEFHRYIIDAQDKRNQADYNIDSGITEAHANEQISRAEQFLELAESMMVISHRVDKARMRELLQTYFDFCKWSIH